MKLLKHIILGCIMAIFASCGHGDSFVVTGAVEDMPTMNLRIVYFVDGKVMTGVTAATDGKFGYEGKLSDRALVEIYDNDYRLMGRFVTDPGDDIDLTLNRTNPYAIKVSGNKLAQRWATFLNDNAEILSSGEAAKRNAAVAGYAAENPSDELSALLIASEYDVELAEPMPVDSLWNTLDEQVRSSALTASFASLLTQTYERASQPVAAIAYLLSGNRTATFVPSHQRLAVIAVSDNRTGRDSIVEVLRKLEPHRRDKKFDILDLSVDSDTLAWRRSVANDSAKWTQGWAAGSISGQALNRLGIPAVPYFVVTDSTGAQIWRGRSAAALRAFVLDKLAEK